MLQLVTALDGYRSNARAIMWDQTHTNSTCCFHTVIYAQPGHNMEYIIVGIVTTVISNHKCGVRANLRPCRICVTEMITGVLALFVLNVSCEQRLTVRSIDYYSEYDDGDR